jgi:tryptophanyl-tRNA synthetase
MTQYKDKSANLTQANKTTSIPVGLFMYPVLMAADILLYDVDYVVVGIDQKQHLELCNDIAIRMNKKYGNLFKIPEPMIDKSTAKIMDLKNPSIKMSKSNVDVNGTVFLLDSVEIATKKIMSSKTDSLNKVKFDITNQPGVSNLLTIYSSLSGESIESLENMYKDTDYGQFKKDLAKVLGNFLLDFQTRYHKAFKEFAQIEKHIFDNTKKCNTIANDKIELVKKKIGLI